MSEEIQEPQRKKTYLLMVDELNMSVMRMAMPGLQFVDVEAMNMADNPTHQVLVTPLPKPKEEPKTEEPPCCQQM